MELNNDDDGYNRIMLYKEYHFFYVQYIKLLLYNTIILKLLYDIVAIYFLYIIIAM